MLWGMLLEKNASVGCLWNTEFESVLGQRNNIQIDRVSGKRNSRSGVSAKVDLLHTY